MHWEKVVLNDPKASQNTEKSQPPVLKEMHCILGSGWVANPQWNLFRLKEGHFLT